MRKENSLPKREKETLDYVENDKKVEKTSVGTEIKSTLKKEADQKKSKIDKLLIEGTRRL